MELIEALYTTRAMRRLKSDPVPQDVQMRMFDAAFRAPIGSNDPKAWLRFLTVTDADTKIEIGALYRDKLAELNRTRYNDVQQSIRQSADDPALVPAVKMDASARYLADHLYEVPLMVFAFGKEGGEASVFPALWSMCLAARSEGYGTVFTTLLNRLRSEIYQILRVPDDAEWKMMAMVPCGLPIGPWGLAKRMPVHEAVYADRWEQPVSWRADEPVWTPPY